MPTPALETDFNAARDRYRDAAGALVPLLVRMALDSIADVLPGAKELEAEGRFIEDWIVSDRLAHSSTHITSEIYTYVTRPMQSDAAERVAARILRRS